MTDLFYFFDCFLEPNNDHIIPRDDNSEFLELSKIVLDGEIQRKRGYVYMIQRPRTDIHAQWRSKAIYTLSWPCYSPSSLPFPGTERRIGWCWRSCPTGTHLVPHWRAQPIVPLQHQATYWGSQQAGSTLCRKCWAITFKTMHEAWFVAGISFAWLLEMYPSNLLQHTKTQMVIYFFNFLWQALQSCIVTYNHETDKSV